MQLYSELCCLEPTKYKRMQLLTNKLILQTVDEQNDQKLGAWTRILVL